MPIKKGQKYYWKGMRIEVLRVASDGAWADIQCSTPFNKEGWTKRQPTPGGAFPREWRLMGKGMNKRREEGDA
jgi:hypothetical protein